MKTWTGVLDRPPFPAKLTGHVVEPGDDPRMCGYAVMGDLAPRASFLDAMWLSMRGEMPSGDEREALSRALIWLCPLHVGEGPTHAAVLARIAGAPDEVVPAIGVAALGQLVAAELRALTPFFQWLREPGEAPVPEAAQAREVTREARAQYEALARDTARWFGPARALPRHTVLTRVAAGYGVLHQLGAQRPLQLQAFAIWARLTSVLGEALHAQPGAVMTYPADLPPYRYIEDEAS